MHYHLFTCSKCETEEILRMDEYSTAEQAEAFMKQEENWQTIHYEFGRASFTEHRCPECHLIPINMDDVLTRKRVYA